MRALVISDTHFGAWTGEDILRDPENVALLAPHLDVDEVIMLGDLFDLLFAPAREAFTAAGGLLDLLRDRLLRPRDAIQPAVAAFERVVDRLGWAHDTDKIVFAHTHQPLADVRGPGGRVRYWNTGSWIYEPDLTSHEAYVRYLENAWPGTAVLIDSDEESPRLLRLREHLNSLVAEGSAPLS